MSKMSSRRQVQLCALALALLACVTAPLLVSTGKVNAKSTPHANYVCGARARVTRQQVVKAGTYTKLTDHELSGLIQSYSGTEGFQFLRRGFIGDKAHPLATQLYGSSLEAISNVIKLCVEDGGLTLHYRSAGTWAVPQVPVLHSCGNRKVHLVVLTGQEIKRGPQVTEEMWPSFRARGLPLPAHMISKGHEASWFSQREHSQLFEGCLDNDSYMPPFPLGQEAARRGVSVVGLVVKSRPEAMVKCLLKLGIPVVLDLIDSAVDDFSKYMDYSLILATNRLASDIMSVNTGVSAVTVYHQPANYERFHRADRTRPVRVIAMTHGAESHGLETDDLAQELTRYCDGHDISLRLNHYAGHGFDQEEMARFLQAKHDWGHQLGYAMGYSSVDIGIVWRPCRVVELTCIKPTNRVAEYLSLGIPVVFQATAAYMDIVAESGYPLAANNVSHALQLVDQLVRDADLRQAVSELGLRAAERFHQDRIAEEFERAICSVA